MLEIIPNTRINSDASEDDLKPGEYRDATNISLLANEVGAFSKGTTYGNTDTEIVFNHLNPDAICLGTAIDTTGTRSIVTFYQKIPLPLTPEYDAIITFALSRGMRVPSPQVQAAQNLLVALLKKDGIWVGLDVFFCFFGDGDQEFAKIDWKNPSDATMAFNSAMLYQINFGFKGTGTSYLDTKFVPSTAVKYQLNNGSFIIGYEDILQSPGSHEGVNTPAGWASIAPYTALNTVQFGVNSGTDLPAVVSPQISGDDGIYFCSRTIAGFQAVRQNRGDSVVSPIVSTGKANKSFYLGALNNDGTAANFSTNQYGFFAAGEALNTLDREANFFYDWAIYKSTFTNDLVDELFIQEVLMYLLVDQEPRVVSPLVRSSKMKVTEESYLDGYSFVNELFFFNFRQSAPKIINIDRATISPGFYDELEETSLTVIKPHPPFSPVAARASSGAGATLNSPILKKAFQFMCLYRFVDGEQSTKSPASEYLNSLDDVATVNSDLDFINVTIKFPEKDYSIVKEIELFVRNTNNIGDWRSVTLLPKNNFSIDPVDNNYYNVLHQYKDDAIGGFLPLDLATKINDAVPQKSNYLAFIENRLFLIDSLLDYNFVSTFQIKITLDANAVSPDDRTIDTASPLYAVAEFEYDSEYTVGIAFYDEYGRKYPSSINDRRFTTPVFVPVTLPAGADTLPDYTVQAQLQKAKITAKYDLRAAGNETFYGKPPSWAYWWGMIRTKNTKWEFQQSIQCLLRFPYSITKWGDTDPAKFPDPNLFLEDGYLYWNPEKLLGLTGNNVTLLLSNEYIDVVIPPNFPYPLDKNILLDFMMRITTDVAGTRISMVNREVVETFANKIRIRGDRTARWFSTAGAGIGQYKVYPKFTTGVNLDAGKVLLRDETTFPIVVKRRKQSNLDNIILYDTPQIYPIPGAGSLFSTFQPGQSIAVSRVDFNPIYILPKSDISLKQLDTLIQPIFLEPTTVAINHSIKILWGPNTGDSARLKIEVSIWSLTDLKQPAIKKFYKSTGQDGKPYYVGNEEVIEYSIAPREELTTGWYGYGIQILDAQASARQFFNPSFEVGPADPAFSWLQSFEVGTSLNWTWLTVDKSVYVTAQQMSTNNRWSKTIYQLLDGAEKEDLTIEVDVEGYGFLGPVSNGATAIYPGTTPAIPTNNANEIARHLNYLIVPYYVICNAPTRKVTLGTVKFQKTSLSPPGATVEAQLWRLNADNSPNSPIPGSLSPAPVALPTASGGQISVPLGSTVLDTTGWYGVALLFKLPVFADFENKDYSQGANKWIATGGSPQFVFQPFTQLPDTFAYTEFGITAGADKGYLPMGNGINLMTPVFFGNVGSAYDNHSIKVDWGDNVNNGWQGGQVLVAIWELNQSTLRPLTSVPLMYTTITIGSNGVQEYFISNAQSLAPSKWYGFGLRNPSNHPNPNYNQFVNNAFASSLSGWTITNPNWFWSNGANFPGSQIPPSGNFDLGYFRQAISGYVQVVLPFVIAQPNAGTAQIFVELTKNGVVLQTIDATYLTTVPVSSGNSSIGGSVAFECFAFNGETLGIRIYGTNNSSNLSIGFSGIFNQFSPYLFSTPKVRKRQISDPNYQSWINFASNREAIVDTDWREAGYYWKRSAVGQVDNMLMQFRTGVFAGVGEIILICSGSFSGGTSDLMYSRINMTDAPITTFSLNALGEVSASAGANAFFEVWVFNDPNNFTAGVLVYSKNFVTSQSWVESGTQFNIPAGYAYIGYRWRDVNGNAQISLRQYELGPFVHYNSWYKDIDVFSVIAKERYQSVVGGSIAANFNATNIAPGATTGRLGQDYLFGQQVRVDVEVFDGLANGNKYDLILYDSNGFEIGRAIINSQDKGTNVTQTVTATTNPSTTGLYIGIQNKNPSTSLSVRVRNITNINFTVTIAAHTPAVANANTWQRDASGNNLQLATTTVSWVEGTQDVPSPAEALEIIMSDGSATAFPTSASKFYTPDGSRKLLTFTPLQQPVNNYNYGIKVRNSANNSQTAGTLKIHSIRNIAKNTGVAHVIGNTISVPTYEAWIQPASSGAWFRAGYVSNFIAAVSDLVMSPFTPIAINPDSYHVAANMVQVGVAGHSTTYATPLTVYNYGIPFPSISSDPDSAGIVYIEKTGQSIGDINIRILDLGQKSQSNIVRWSDPIIVGTRTNNTNAFSDGNKYPVDFQRGIIQVMVAMHDHTLFCVHTQGMSSLYVSRAIMTSSSEIEAGDQLVLTSKVVGNDNKLTSNLGTVNPESVKVVESGTIAYGFDLIHKAFWQKTNNGVRNLTYECNAKTLFNQICFFRLLAYNEGENIKIYAGYNEKQKIFYLSFAEFVYRGSVYPAETIAYSAYIDGFLSRYSFEPASYLATESTVHTVKARSLNNPDFFGDFDFWLQDSSTSDYQWILKKGQWNDDGYWDDNEHWIDNLVV